MDEKTHHAIDELNAVHNKMKRKFQNQSQMKIDIARAKKMQDYLQLFKKIGNNDIPEEQRKDVNFQRELSLEGMEEIVKQVGTFLNIQRYKLFQNRHEWYRGEKAKLGADDIFEAELYALLIKAGEMALKDEKKDIKLGVNLIGGVAGNIKDSVNIAQSTEEIFKKMMDGVSDKDIQKFLHETEIITTPTARSAKVDVTGYNKSFDISSSIKPEWQDFIKTFQGANFSVKNYSSKTKYVNNVIHLGNTNTLKAMYGILSSLGYGEKKATHIYAHTKFSYLLGHSAAKGEGPSHILHMRFAYELTGAGLWTETDDGLQQLDEVDFFIYNDPSSDNIFVRSTKEMISQSMDYLDTSNIGDPWNSSIVILKSSF